jgi:transposase
MVSRKPHPAELRERAVRMVFEVRAETDNPRGSIARVADRLGINKETLRNWVAQAEVDDGQRPGTTTEDRKKIAELERENRELRRANEILKAASAYFARELCATRRRVDRAEVGDLRHRAVAAAW